MDRSYVAANTHSRERLMALIDQLSDDDWNRSLGEGWTIAAVLAHLAFWDYRVLILIKKWESAEISDSPIDPDVVNDAIQPLCRALPPRAAANLAIEAAQAVDYRLETLETEMYSQIINAGTPINFRRSDHREEHLAQIERLLSE